MEKYLKTTQFESLFSRSAYEGKLAAFLEFVLDAYVSDGIGELDRKKLPDLLELKFHRSATEGAVELGGPEVVAEAFVGFQRHLFQE